MTMNREVVDRLRMALPLFEQEWERYKQSELYGPGESYNDVAQIARFMVEAMASANTDGFATLFGTVNGLLEEGTPDVRNLVAVGFLEDLQNLSLNAGIPLDAWTEWLQPSTKEAWRELAGLWDGSISIDDFHSYMESGVSRGPTDVP